MSTMRVGTSVACSNKRRMSGSIVRHAIAAMLLVLFAFQVVVPAAAEVSAGHDVRITGDRTKQQFLAGYRVHVGAAVPEPRTGGRIGWTLLGILILLIAWAVPFVGWIFAFLALLGGPGAVAAGLRPWARKVEPGEQLAA